VDVAYGPIRVVARLISQPNHAFFGAFEVPAGVFVLLGTVKEEKEELRTAVTASAAYSYLQQEITQSGPELALQQAGLLFSFERVECIHWIEKSQRGQLWRFSPSTQAATESELKLDSESPYPLHTFSEDEDAIIRRFIEYYGNLPLPELLSDIVAALPDGRSGALLLFRRE
jgi:hypothetical protein